MMEMGLVLCNGCCVGWLMKGDGVLWLGLVSLNGLLSVIFGFDPLCTFVFSLSSCSSSPFAYSTFKF